MNGAASGANGATNNAQLISMGYMPDGQFMMPPHGSNAGQLPAGDHGVPHLVGQLGDMPNTIN